MTCVTGVSGSGKSSLVKGILYPALRRTLFDTGIKPGDFDALEGDVQLLKSVEMVDQNRSESRRARIQLPTSKLTMKYANSLPTSPMRSTTA